MLLGTECQQRREGSEEARDRSKNNFTAYRVSDMSQEQLSNPLALGTDSHNNLLNKDNSCMLVGNTSTNEAMVARFKSLSKLNAQLSNERNRSGGSPTDQDNESVKHY